MAGKEVTTTAPYGAYLPALDDEVLREFGQTMRDNIGSGGLGTLDLPRIRIPTGGGLSWTVPTLEGAKPMSELKCAVIHWTPLRAFWQTAYGAVGSAGNSPPDCSSQDGVVGHGDPGGDCATCIFNEWGTKVGQDGNQTRGKACKEMRGLFAFMPELGILPFVVMLSPMSIKPLKDYFLALASNALPYYKVETTLALEQSKNRDGITYSRVVPKMSRRFTAEEVTKVGMYRDQIRPVIEGVVLTPSDMQD